MSNNNPAGIFQPQKYHPQPVVAQSVLGSDYVMNTNVGGGDTLLVSAPEDDQILEVQGQTATFFSLTGGETIFLYALGKNGIRYPLDSPTFTQFGNNLLNSIIPCVLTKDGPFEGVYISITNLVVPGFLYMSYVATRDVEVSLQELPLFPSSRALVAPAPEGNARAFVGVFQTPAPCIFLWNTTPNPAAVSLFALPPGGNETPLSNPMLVPSVLPNTGGTPVPAAILGRIVWSSGWSFKVSADIPGIYVYSASRFVNQEPVRPDQGGAY